MSSEKIVSLDTDVFKVPRLITDKILDVDILSRQKRSNIHTSPHATLSAL